MLGRYPGPRGGLILRARNGLNAEHAEETERPQRTKEENSNEETADGRRWTLIKRISNLCSSAFICG